MNNSETIDKIKQMDVFEKLSIYMKYYIDCIALKHSSLIVDTKKESLNGYSKNYEAYLGLAIFKPFNNNIMSFEQFVSEANVKIIDYGEQWKDNGWAQKIRTELSGIYDYIRK